VRWRIRVELIALAMARETRLPATSGAHPASFTHRSKPYFHTEAVALLGAWSSGSRLIPVDKQFRRSAAASCGHCPRISCRSHLIAVVAFGRYRHTGAEIRWRIGAVFRSHGLWLPRDVPTDWAPLQLVAAEKFLGFVLRIRLSVDLHKWLYQPVDCGILLFKDPAVARTAFIAHRGLRTGFRCRPCRRVCILRRFPGVVHFVFEH